MEHFGAIFGHGGDGAAAVFNADSLYPVTDRQVFNLNARYDFTENLTGFIETKYVKAESETYGEYDGYFDTIEIKSDNRSFRSSRACSGHGSGGLLGVY